MLQLGDRFTSPSIGPYVLFKFTCEEAVPAECRSYLARVFNAANDLHRLRRSILEYQNDTFQFTLCRALVSELYIWKYGLGRISGERLRSLPRDWSIAASNSKDLFDRYFGDVQKLRNVIQHAGPYLYDKGGVSPVSQRELDRIGLRIRLQPGARLTFHENVVGDHFVSGDRSGKLKRVYIGPNFHTYIDTILTGICRDMSQVVLGQMKLVRFKDLTDYRTALDRQQNPDLE